MTGVEVANPFNKTARVDLEMKQTNPYYRSYLEHTSLLLKPKEVKKVNAMFEYTGDDSGERISEDKKTWPNNVGIVSFIWDPIFPADTPRVLGGCQAEIVSGLSTRFENFDFRDKFYGTVVSNDGKKVPSGKIIMIITKKNGERVYTNTDLREGEFYAPILDNWISATAYYVPSTGFADCMSKRMLNKKKSKTRVKRRNRN
jgi:hypothetical protein